MLPRDLKPEHFSGYPQQARRLVTEYLGALPHLPLSFLPSLLREVIEYDFKFPAERKAVEREVANLNRLSPEQLKEWFHEFDGVHLSPALEKLDWINAPAQFVEKLSAHLWATHQMYAFRKAAMDYADRLRAAVPPEEPGVPRLGITIIGQGVTKADTPLFRKLRPYGTYFSRINPENGVKQILNVAAARAKQYPVAYGHWYIEGGTTEDHDPALTCTSYPALERARAALLRKMRTEIERLG